MNIKKEFPPNIDEIKAILAVNGAVFTYDGTIYNPFNVVVTPDLYAHEEVHEKQQDKIGADYWWKRYLNEGPFRLSQEIPAYQAQFKKAQEVIKDRNKLSKYALSLARFLSQNYGEIISFDDAYKAIRSPQEYIFEI